MAAPNLSAHIRVNLRLVLFLCYSRAIRGLFPAQDVEHDE